MFTYYGHRSNSAVPFRHQEVLATTTDLRACDDITMIMPGHVGPYIRTPKLPLRKPTTRNVIIRPHTTGTSSQLTKNNTFGLPFTPKRISVRVERALRHFEDDKEFCFYKRGKPQRMVVTERGEVRSPTPLNQALGYFNAYSNASSYVETDGDGSGDCQDTSTENTTTLITESTDSVSLNPGVFNDKNPKPRIFVRYRQLSAHELVMDWLFRSCNHPCKTLPLI